MLGVSTAATCMLPAGQRPFQAAHQQRRNGRTLCPRAGSGASTSSGGDASGGAGSGGELPPELQGLCISDDGQYLIDSKTGKVVNEFGATRFDVAVRAMRGEFDPPEYLENSERASGLLLDSLTQFPAIYDFQLVVKLQPPPQQQLESPEPASSGSSSSSSAVGQGSSSSSSSSGGSSGAGAASMDERAAVVLERYRQVIADTTAADIPAAACTVKPRLGGKYLSLTIPARVQAAHVVDLVWEALKGDPALIMKF